LIIILFLLLMLRCKQLLLPDSIQGLLLHSLQQRNHLNLLVPGKKVHQLPADSLIDFLTIARNLYRLSLIQRVVQVRRHYERQFLTTDPVHLKDGREGVLSASQAGRQDPIDRWIRIGDQVRGQSGKAGKATRFFG
jgi:hypothetical protein